MIKECGLLSSSPGDDGSILVPVKARLATTTELCLYHDKAYVEFVLSHSSAPVADQTSDFGIEDVRITQS